MTTGSWTIGDGSTAVYAQKSWAGGNGKTEAWAGGTRSKWNNYSLTHVIRRLSRTIYTNPEMVGYGLPLPPNFSAGDLRGYVGWSNNDDLRLLNKLAESIRGHSFDLGVNIAEATKSYGTVVSNVRSIGSALYSLKHGRYSQALRTLGSNRRPPHGGGIRRLNAKDLSGRWLETQYAFMPMVSQSYEAAKALEAVTKPRVLRFSAGLSTKRRTYEGSDTLSNYSFPQYCTYSSRLTAELYEDMSLQRSLGLTNPVEIAWELVPYSFVVDWFLPIGSYISAWGMIPSLTGRFMTTQRGAIKSGPPVVYTDPKYGQWGLRQNRFVMARTVSTSLSIPRPQFNGLPAALSPRRLLSAVALIHQRLR
jgi:hypothetical protein